MRMKTQKANLSHVDGIFCADIHLRETIPECRTDDFIEAQTNKLHFIGGLQEKYGCPIMVAGDIFHHWKPSPWLITYALRNLPDGIIAIPGQHDLPAHSLEHIDKSGIQVLSDAGKIELLVPPYRFSGQSNPRIVGFPFGTELTKSEKKNETLALIHYLVYKDELPFPGADHAGGNARSVMRKLRGYNCIVSGDNHTPLVEKYHNQLLVNPGSMMRSTAAQADFRPRVYLWNAELNEATPVYLPIEKGVVSREHLDIVEERDNRINAFVQRLKHDVEIGLSFEKNLKEYIRRNKIDKEVEQIIWDSLRK